MATTILDLVRRFSSGEIRLPLMQRDYVWKSKKVIKLLDSLHKGWPIGCFYVWRSEHDQPRKASAGGHHMAAKSMDGFYGYLLDGQQRLTSLRDAIEPQAEDNLPGRAFFDLENERFVMGASTKTIRRRVEAGDPLLVPLSDLIPPAEANPTELHANVQKVVDHLAEHKGLGRNGAREVEYRQRLHTVAEMLNVDALCGEFSDDHIENAIELFARLNKGGTSLSSGDVQAARLAEEATAGIVPLMREFVQEADSRALGLNFSFVTRALVTLHRGNSSFQHLPRNWATGTGDIRESWKRTEKGLRYAIALVHELGWMSRRWLPSANALIPIAYLFKEAKTEPVKADREIVARFLFLTGLRGIFRGWVETTINTFVNPIRRAPARTRSYAALLADRIPRNRLYRIKPEDVRSASGMYSPLMQIYLAYLVSRGAKSWPSSRPIREVATQHPAGDPLAVHHVFSKKFMHDLDVPTERLNTAANYAILAQSDNAEIGDRDPRLVHKELSPAQRQIAAEQLFFQVDDGRLAPEAYDEFIDARAKAMADRLNAFLEL